MVGKVRIPTHRRVLAEGDLVEWSDRITYKVYPQGGIALTDENIGTVLISSPMINDLRALLTAAEGIGNDVDGEE